MRGRILAAFAAQLDRVIPADESISLKGVTFADFEDHVETGLRGCGASGALIQRRTARNEPTAATEPTSPPRTPSNAPDLEGAGLEGTMRASPLTTRSSGAVSPQAAARAVRRGWAAHSSVPRSIRLATSK